MGGRRTKTVTVMTRAPAVALSTPTLSLIGENISSIKLSLPGDARLRVGTHHTVVEGSDQCLPKKGLARAAGEEAK